MDFTLVRKLVLSLVPDNAEKSGALALDDLVKEPAKEARAAMAELAKYMIEAENRAPIYVGFLAGVYIAYFAHAKPAQFAEYVDGWFKYKAEAEADAEAEQADVELKALATKLAEKMISRMEKSARASH